MVLQSIEYLSSQSLSSGWEMGSNLGFTNSCPLFDLCTQLANKHQSSVFIYLGGFGRVFSSQQAVLPCSTMEPVGLITKKLSIHFLRTRPIIAEGEIVRLLWHYPSDKFK